VWGAGVSFTNLTFAFSGDSCALSPGGCSNVGRDGAGPAQSMVDVGGAGTTFSGVWWLGAGNAALYCAGATNVTVERANFSECGGNCVEAGGPFFRASFHSKRLHQPAHSQYCTHIETQALAQCAHWSAEPERTLCPSLCLLLICSALHVV
jgi:hypothetical protein